MPRDIGNSLQVSLGSSLPTYVLTANDIAPVTASYDIFNIANPSGSTVALVVSRIYMVMDATAASTMDGYLVRRTAANTGGTAVPIVYNASTAVYGGSATFAPHDTNDTASQAVINGYSVNPTYGAGLTLNTGHLSVSAAATPSTDALAWETQYLQRGAKPLIIRPGQYLAPSFGGQTTPTGASMYLTIEWLEVPLISLF